MMLRKFYYLTSVSVLASMVMNLAAQAMESEQDGRSVKSLNRRSIESQQTEDVSLSGNMITESDIENNIRLLIEEENAKTQAGVTANALGGAFDIAIETVADWGIKAHTTYQLAKQIYNNNYEELASEAMDAWLASYVEEGQKNFFKNANKEFDPAVLRKVAMKLTDSFFLYLARIDDIYGLTDEGARVTIYNKSLFKMLFNKCFPDVGGVGGVVASIMDNGRFKSFVQERMIDTVLYYLNDLTSKKEIGQKIQGVGEFLLCGESSFDASQIWKYLSPHINYHLRNFIIQSIKRQKTILLEEKEKTLWYGTIPTTAAGLGAMLYANSFSVLYYPLVPFVYSAGTRVLDRTKNNANEWLDKKIENWAHNFITRSKVEHVLYWLNQNPSDIERGLAYKDYKLLDEHNSTGYLSSIAGGISNMVGIAGIYHSLYGSIFGVNDSSIEYSPAEDSLKAYRLFMLLKKDNPKEAENILKNLEKYPSYEEYEKRKLNKTLGIKNQRSVDVIKSTQKTLQKIEETAQIMVEELHTSLNGFLLKEYMIKMFLVEQLFGNENYRKESETFIKQNLLSMFDGKLVQISAARESIYKVFLDEIMNSTIEVQDFIIPWVKDHQKNLKQCFQHIKYDDLFGKKTIQIVNKQGGIELPQINKEKVKNFFKPTSTEVTWSGYLHSFFQQTLVEHTIADHVKDFIKKESRNYFEKHDLSSFKSLSITENLDDDDIVKLHKHLVNEKAQNQDFFEKLMPEIRDYIFSLLGKQGLINLAHLSRNYFKLGLDMIDERKFNGLFDIKILNTEERDYLIQHYHDIVLIEEAYRKLKLDHFTHTLFEIFKENMEKNGVFERVELAIKEELSKEKGEPLSRKQMYDKVCMMLDATPEFQGIYNSILPFKKDPALYDAFRIQRDKRRLKSADKIRNDLSKTMSTYTAVTETLSGLLPKSWSTKEATPIIYIDDEQAVEKKFRQIKVLEAHDPSSKGERIRQLTLVMNEMEFDNVFELSIKDFIKIHQGILNNKWTETSESDKKFIIMYGKEIYGYKSKSPFDRDWLFKYKYSNLIQKIRNENEIIITPFQSKK